jgi:hypothetical protein
VHTRARGRKVHHRLASGVAGAHDHHVLIRALHGLAAAGAVVDPVVEQLLDAVQLEPPPLHPARHQHDVSGHLVATRERPAHRLPGREVAPHHPVQDQQLRAEALGLPACQSCQLGPADPVHEPEKVLDPRRVRGLAARHVFLGDRRGQAVRGAVHRRGEPGRTGADDQEVVVRMLRTRVDLPRVGQALDRGVGVDRVPVDHHGQLRVQRAGIGEHRLRVGQAGLVELVRLSDAREEVTQAVILRIQPASHHVQAGARWAHTRSLRGHTCGARVAELGQTRSA